MTIIWRGRQFTFRKCDVNGKTKNEVEQIARKKGKMQYEPRKAWLYVPGIGFGWQD